MKLKTIEVEGKTYAEVADGKPLFVADDGKDVAFDAPGTVATISRLNGEAKSHREGKEAAEKALKAFEGIEDPSKALEALKTVSNLDAKKLIDAGEVEKVKAEMAKVYDAQLAEKDKENGELKTALNEEVIGGAFSRSKFISDKMAVPADVVEAVFGSKFKVEGGKPVAFDANGNQIRSRSNPAELASFEEAIETLVAGYVNADSLLKGNGGQGSGAKNGDAGGSGAKTMARAEFDALPEAEKNSRMKDGYTLTE